MIKLDLLQVCKSGLTSEILCKLTYQEYNEKKKTNHIILSTDRKTVDQIQPPFMIKTQQTQNRKELLQLSKEYL